tara:strand:+ start:1819 stop:2361 length:543 start_codon:yes stop_codon:yes gene_type:complete
LKIVFDTCVLYPTFLRKVLLAIAKNKLFVPIWSNDIFNEWLYAVRKLGSLGEDQVRAEIALLKYSWPESIHTSEDFQSDDLWLPDSNDVHILTTAISSRSDAILTFNTKDFPTSILSKYNLIKYTPDEFLGRLWVEYPNVISKEVNEAYNIFVNKSKLDVSLRKVLKKSKLSGVGKLLIQ